MKLTESVWRVSHHAISHGNHRHNLTAISMEYLNPCMGIVRGRDGYRSSRRGE
jgi:hypothetical protein